MVPSKTERWLLLLALVGCASLGFAVAIGFELSPFGSNPALDEEGYVKWGLRIAAGDWLGSKVFYQEPLYPYFLGVIFALTNGSLLAARLLQVALSTGTAYLIYRLGQRLFSTRVGVLAAFMFALIGVVHLYSAELIKVTLVTHVSAWVCWLGIEAGEQKHRRALRLLVVGALYGALMLLRGNFVAMLPLLGLWVLALSVTSRQWLLVPALVIGLAVPLAPVAIRNHAISGEWILTTSQGGQNFFIGNSSYADGMYATIDWVRATPIYEARDFQREAERRAGHAMKPGEVSRFWFSESFAFLKANPARGLELVWHKFLLLVHAYEIPDNYSLTCFQETFIPVLNFAPLGAGFLFFPALGALWVFRKQRSLWFPAAFAVTYCATVVLFFVVSRYRMPAVPMLCVLSAAFVTTFAEWVASREWRKAGVSFVVVGGGLLFSVWPLSFIQTGVQLEAQCQSSIGVTLSGSGRIDEAVPYLEKAHALTPQNAEISYNLGSLYQLSGRHEEALVLYRKTLSAKPHHAQAAFNAGLILMKTQPKEAEALFVTALKNGLETEAVRSALARVRSAGLPVGSPASLDGLKE